MLNLYFNLNFVLGEFYPMKFVFFVIAAVVAIFVGVVVLRFNETPPAPPPVVQSEPSRDVAINTVDVLVAKVDVPVGTVIDSTMVDTQPWPQHLVLDNFISASPASAGAEVGSYGAVLGKVSRSSIQAREPFVKSKLADPNDPGFISAGLPSGMRAITIPVDSISGVAGYVFPGDHVDILFSHPSKASVNPLNDGFSVSEVVAANVRVLAVGVRQLPPSPGENEKVQNSSQPVGVSDSVTIEISDGLVQHIRLAEKNGSLSLALRSIKDDNSTSPLPTTLGDISRVSDGAALIVVRGPGKGSGSDGKITSSDGLAVNLDVVGRVPRRN